MLEQMGKTLSQLEAGAVDIVSRLAPWASPLPTAYLTMRATVEHLAWPQTMGIIAGGIIEALGLASVSTALQLRDYNRTKRKSDPSAPVGLAVLCAGIYFSSIIVLTVLLDTMPELAAHLKRAVGAYDRWPVEQAKSAADLFEQLGIEEEPAGDAGYRPGPAGLAPVSRRGHRPAGRRDPGAAGAGGLDITK